MTRGRWAVAALVGLAAVVGAALFLPQMLDAPEMLAPGVRCETRVLAGPVRLHLLTLDLKTADARLAVRTAGPSLANLASLAQIAAPRDATQEVLAAVNAGQFDRDGTPIGLLVVDKAMLRGGLGRPTLTLNEEGSPFISRFSSSLTYATQQFKVGLEVERYNRPGAGTVCLYSDAYPFEIPAPTGSLFLTVRGLLAHGIYAAKPTYGRITAVDVISAATTIVTSPGRLTVRLVGLDTDTLSQMHFVNQVVSINPRIEGPLWSGEITYAVGGSDILLSEGQVPAELRDEERMGLDNRRDARTAVGYSQDHMKIFLAVVEGGRAGSVGMTLSELARLLLEEKAWDALNLDGGGSSGLWVAGRGVVSVPDSARPINNALVLVRKP